MSYIKYDPVTRRTFLKGIGGWIAIPFMSSLIPLPARAAAVNRKRFIAITTPNQFPAHWFFPTGLQSSTVPSDLAGGMQTINESPFSYRSMPLSSVIATRGQISPFFSPTLNSYASKMALYRGVDMPGMLNHGRAAVLGNIAASHLGGARNYKPMRTMDEFLANSNGFYTGGKAGYRFPIMRLGETSISTSSVSDSNPFLGFEIGGNNSGVTAAGNLTQIFNAMFASQASAANKVAVVDRLKDGINALTLSGKPAKSDMQSLSDYRDALSDLGSSLGATTTSPQIPKPSLSFPTYNGQGIGTVTQAVQNTHDYYVNLAQLMTLAVKVNSSKIFTVGVDSALTNASYCMSQEGSVAEWHLTAHAGDVAKLTAMQKFIFENVFVQVMKGLDTVEADGSTYLDNTIMMMTGEQSNGHSGINYGGILAGGGAAGLGLGQAYDFSNWASGSVLTTGNVNIAPGQPINRLWVGILKSLGLNETDYLNRFGNGGQTFGIWTSNYGTSGESEFGQVKRDNYLAKSLPGLFST